MLTLINLRNNKYNNAIHSLHYYELTVFTFNKKNYTHQVIKN